MWQERADYGHFFYRIPNGESAADAYDRISGFNESLWRQFNEPDFPSVCVLVTHGLMTRVFLMKWYHWSVEYFEDLRNINHCEFIVMEKNTAGKYALETKLRTWSELKRQKAEAEEDATGVELKDLQRRNTLSRFLPNRPKITASPPSTKWGGCVGGCQHDHDRYPRRILQKPSNSSTLPLPAAANSAAKESKSNEHEDNPLITPAYTQQNPFEGAHSTDGSTDESAQSAKPIPTYLLSGRDGGGIDTIPTPHEDDQASREYFAKSERSLQMKLNELVPQRRPTVEDFERWASESGMGKGVRADALGDDPQDQEELDRRSSTDFDAEKAHESSVQESVY